MAKAERCVCCGEIIPEGQQICPECKKGKRKMAELKPCPFCGGRVSIAKMGDNGNTWWFVTRGYDEDRCTCRLFMESEDFFYDAPEEEQSARKAELIEAWNRRAKDGK